VEAAAVSAAIDSAKDALNRISVRAKWEDILGAFGTARHREALHRESLRAIAKNAEKAKQPALIFALLLFTAFTLHAVFARDIPSDGSRGSTLLGWGSLFLQYVAYFLSAITLFITLDNWRAYIKAFGRPSRSRCSRTVRSRALIDDDTVLGGERFACDRSVFTFLAVALALSLINVWADSHLILSLVVFQVSMAIWILLRDACPPAVLAVAAANEQGFRLQAELRLVLTQRFEDAVFLDMAEGVRNARGGYIRLGDRFRVFESAEWLRAAWSLCKVVHVVMIDARCNTPNVILLASRGLRARWSTKVVVVSDPEDTQPLISSLADAGIPLPRKQVLKTDDWPHFINAILRQQQSP